MSHTDNQQDILCELGRIIAQHSDWLDGRTFQRLTMEAAAAYFAADDLDALCRLEEFVAALTKELSGLSGSPVEI